MSLTKEATDATDTPRVDGVIELVMRKYPGLGGASRARYFEAVHQELAPLARELEREVDHRWRNGYFCAVAVLLREEGSESQVVRSLFGQGGSTEGIDAGELALFREHGLID